MAEIAIAPEALKDTLATALGALAQHVSVALGEVTVTVAPAQYHEVMKTLRDAAGCRFEQLIDLCGVDYSTYGDGRWEGPRFAVVSHLLSVSLNQRVRSRSMTSGVRPTGSSARRSTCTASCSKATPTCAAS